MCSIYTEIFFIFCISSLIECFSVPCTFNTMCMCWIQDDEDFTKMDINCMGVPFARFPGRWNEITLKINLFSFL